jgi:endoglucanase
MKQLVDPLDNLAIEFHQYFDSDSSGTSTDCVRAQIGVERLSKATAWLRKQGLRGFMGELATANNPVCTETLKHTLNYMLEHSDVWMGWTWWAAGAWWGNYPFSISPKDGEDKPQMATLEIYLKATH